ncbi:hypothetical protein KFE25_014236 [Diacronema lutheri]|uniref:Desulfoferrodoxin ferrous iron-binding domain-containing protein n=2 Tax=Diacronema lutheri TaxID=2081491 RepID=A0A8J5X3L6_DIALT|nr:hypothetical protein KFE25_014236 [Diacronema lutheri]
MGSSNSTPAVSDELKAEIAPLEAKKVLTVADPGEFAGKEGKHVPTIAVAESKATIVVPHGMEEAHWIQYIWAKNESGALIGAVKLSHTDSPTLTVDVPAGTKAITAFESCNLHGVWKTDDTPIA